MYRTCMVSDPVTIIDVAHNIKHDIAHFPFFFFPHRSLLQVHRILHGTNENMSANFVPKYFAPRI